MPAAFKKAAAVEKVRRQAEKKDYGHSYAVAAKILGCKQGTIKSRLSRNKEAFAPPEYLRDSRNRRNRILRESDIALLREMLKARKVSQA
jgi:hypothetical protein